MKKLIVIIFALFITTIFAQKIKGKSNEIAFKGSSVIAEEIRLVEESRRIGEEKRVAEKLRLEENRKKTEEFDSLTL